MSWGEDDPGPDRWDGSGEADAAAQILDAVERQVQVVVRRGVPIRSLRPGPVHGVARLRLADTTTLLVSSAAGAHLGRIVRALYGAQSLTIASYERSTEGLQIALSGVPGRDPAHLWVLGPDQPD